MNCPECGKSDRLVVEKTMVSRHNFVELRSTLCIANDIPLSGFWITSKILCLECSHKFTPGAFVDYLTKDDLDKLEE